MATFLSHLFNPLQPVKKFYKIEMIGEDEKDNEDGYL